MNPYRRRFITLFIALLPLLMAQGQVYQFTANRLFAGDSLRVNDWWIKKFTRNLNSTDSDSHSMIPTNRAVMDAIHLFGGGGSGGSQTWQQSLVTGSAFTRSNAINQAGFNLVFGGGGKVQGDSFSIKKTITPFIAADSLVGFGHSIMAGTAATVTDSNFLSRVGRFHSLFVSNQGVPSSTIWSAVKIQMSWLNTGHNAYTAYMAAINDVRTVNILSAANRTTINSIVNGLKAMWMNHMAKTSYGGSDASLTRSGSWSTNWNATVEAGKKTNAAYTTSAGAYIEYTFTDSTVGFQVMGMSSGGAGTVTVTIDGSTVETFSINNQHDGRSGSYMPTAKFYTGLTNVSHTIRITNTSGNLMIVDYFTNLRDAATAPPIVFFHECHLDATGYSGGQASDASIDTINVKYDSLRNALPAPWKVRTIVARTNTRYVANTSSGLSGDHVHPNNLGHGQIALTEQNAVNSVIGADSGTIQYGADGFYYGDAKKIAYQNSIGIQDAVNNNPTFNAPAVINSNNLPISFNNFSAINFSNFKINTVSNSAIMHGTLGIQGALGSLAVYGRDGDTTKGFLWYCGGNKLKIFDFFNAVDVAVRDTSFRELYRNNKFNSIISTPTATIHIAGNDLGIQGHASLKIDSGMLMATAEKYAIEVDGNHIYWTDRLSTRRQLDQQGSIDSALWKNDGTMNGDHILFGNNKKLTLGKGVNSLSRLDVAADSIVMSTSGSYGFQLSGPVTWSSTTVTNDNDYISAADHIIFLTVQIAADRTITLPSPGGLGITGREIKIWNKNNTANHWQFSGNVVDAAGAAITTLSNNTWYCLISDGSKWSRTN
jgi:hypothetical protein